MKQTFHSSLKQTIQSMGTFQSWCLFGASMFLVSLPVLIQAPLVRSWPWLSLIGTGGWLLGSYVLCKQDKTQIWGDLLFGFALAWFSGSIYWGWFRAEPLLHVPMEAIGLPIALWALSQSRLKIGSLFFLGSLIGSTVTDIYFFLVDLMPTWRTLIQIDQTEAMALLPQALEHTQTTGGRLWAMVLVVGLCVISILPLLQLDAWSAEDEQLCWWAFSGSVLGTLLVDSLFLLVATQF
ncbi:MAG: DUF3120 domain-containing protein [Acaryochloridaceae cyanobacterium SU_2_1]|nr:DUF3120 domain-containing protein [Acaryochloridaceae cyanobacterium SU_2_1]